MEDRAPAVAAETSSGGHSKRWVMIVVAVVVVLGAGLAVRARTHAGAAASGGPAGSASAEARPVPVVVAKVEQRDVPVYLEGLGSVTALYTVNLKAQVDGRLDKVMFKEGENVKKGQHLAQIDARPFTIALRAAEAATARDRAQLDNAKLNLDRFTQLRAQSLVPQQQVDDQKAMVAQFDAVVAADQTQSASARLNIDYAHIVSPIDGVAGVRLIDPGNLVHASDATGIVVLTQLDPIGVLFTLPEDELPRIAERMAAAKEAGGKLSVEAWGRDGTTKLGTGDLALIDNQINQATATIKLKAIFQNADRSLWPNQFVKARLLLTTRKNALVVPATVVQRGPQGTFAYVVGPDSKVVTRPIVIDSFQGESVLLTSGLTPGETVVVDGQTQLRPGSRISAKPGGSASAPASAAPGTPGTPIPTASGRGAGAAP